MKVVSDVGAAHDAAAGFAEIDSDGAGQQVSLGSSNISSMVDGARVANALLRAVDGLVSAVKAQAESVTALAAEIEDRDKLDSSGWCEAR
ncbi:hypothetical protein ACI2IX_06130 [Leifsonia aquatica]|uniref:hypothetical protein n=1 Tax=Leifsonia aquatica TaxID=144185 RepID=UPI00384DC6F4